MFSYIFDGAGDVLVELRQDPRSAHMKYVFIAPFENLPEQGCKGTVSLVHKSANIYFIRFKSGLGNDYFMPYTISSSLAGMVKVPFYQPRGAIVVTPAMNGCALEVIRQSNGLVFCHDANGIQLDQRGRPSGETVLRAEFGDYAPGGVGEGMVSEVAQLAKLKVLAQFGAALIAVKRGSGLLDWGVWSSLTLSTIAGGDIKYCSVSQFNRVEGGGYVGGFSDG